MYARNGTRDVWIDPRSLARVFSFSFHYRRRRRRRRRAPLPFSPKGVFFCAKIKIKINKRKIFLYSGFITSLINAK
jgi:hypothetical protein